jgi:hypothetical protein
MPLTAQLSVQLKADHVGAATAPDLGTLAQVTHQLLVAKVVDLINGTGAGAVDVLWSDTNTLAASTNTDISLRGGALTNGIGGTSTFFRVKGLVVSATAGNTNNVVLGAAAATQWLALIGTATGTLIIRPGTSMMVMCGAADATGYAVGAGELLRIANSGAGTSVTYDIAIIGCSA